MKVIALALLAFAGALQAQTLAGRWQLFPPQSNTYQVNVQQPINPDGSSVWNAKSTIPVQFKLMQGAGPVVFSSYGANWSYSYVDFIPADDSITIDQLTTISAVYQFLTGNCHGGSLRWSIILGNGDTVYAYYGDVTTPFTDCTSAATSGSNNNPNDQSGMNLLAPNFRTDARYEIQGHTPEYIPWADVLAVESGQVVTDVALVLDSGWGGDQVLVTGFPQNVTVATAGGSATFIPAASGMTAVCPPQQAMIQVSRLGSGGNYTIDEALLSTTPDIGNMFRMVDCKYMFNVSGKSLGPGQYKVDVLINGSPVFQPAPGTLFTLK